MNSKSQCVKGVDTLGDGGCTLVKPGIIVWSLIFLIQTCLCYSNLTRNWSNGRLMFIKFMAYVHETANQPTRCCRNLISFIEGVRLLCCIVHVQATKANTSNVFYTFINVFKNR